MYIIMCSKTDDNIITTKGPSYVCNKKLRRENKSDRPPIREISHHYGCMSVYKHRLVPGVCLQMVDLGKNL